MSRVLKSKSNMKSQQHHLESGVMKEELELLELQEVKDSSTSKTLTNSLEMKKKLKSKEKSVTRESQPKTKEKSLLVKSKNSKSITQTIESSKISDQELTLKEKGLKPFWNSVAHKLSTKLWLPTKIDCVDLELSYWNSSLKSQGLNSWFSVKRIKNSNLPTNKRLPKISSSLLQSLLPKTKDLEITPLEKPKLKAVKVRLYPNPDQKKIIDQWLGASRFTYNKCIEKINKKKTKQLKLETTSKELRDHLAKIKEDGNEWLDDIPYDIRVDCVRDILKAMKATIKTFRSFKFRNRKDPQQSISIRARDWKRARGKYSFLNKIKTIKELPEMEHDVRLIKDSLNQYWVAIPTVLEIKPIRDNQSGKVISIDPGNRCFATCYDPQGQIIEWGVNDEQRIFRLCLTIDQLTSQSTKVDARQRYNLKRKIKRIRKKMRNLVDELHRKLAKWLCTNYQVIVLPEFNVQGMTVKGKRKIGKESVRKMMTLSHYRFKQHLLNKAKEHSVKVLLVTEEYTSKTCGNCGGINSKLGSSKTFVCKPCNLELDRDHNGARNILIKTLSELNSGG